MASSPNTTEDDLTSERCSEWIKHMPSMKDKDIAVIGNLTSDTRQCIETRAHRVQEIQLPGHDGSPGSPDVVIIEDVSGGQRYDIVLCTKSLGNPHKHSFHRRVLFILQSLLKHGGHFAYFQTEQENGILHVVKEKRYLGRLLSHVTPPAPDDVTKQYAALDFVSCRQVSIISQNENEEIKGTLWVYVKGRRQCRAKQTLLDIIDMVYTPRRLAQFEWVFGHNFISSGGLKRTKECVSQLKLTKGQMVLDIGCGIGGVAMHLVKEYDVVVKGIDLSITMVNIAKQRLQEAGIPEKSIDVEVADVTKKEFDHDMFDAIYSQDALLHIPEKESLFTKIWQILKPGGRLLVSDYCCSKSNFSEDFRTYMTENGYNIMPLKDYAKVLESVGFSSVTSQNRTDLFLDTTKQEYDKLSCLKNDFIEKFSEEEYEFFCATWKKKEHCASTEDQILGVFYAEKPSEVS